MSTRQIVHSPRTAVAGWLLCLAMLAVFIPPAQAAPVMVDNFSGTRLGTRTITRLPLPTTSTTPIATYTEANGILTATMGGDGNGQAGIQLDYDFAASPTDLTNNGANTQFFLEFDQIRRASVQNSWDLALSLTVQVTDTSNVTGSYNVGISSTNAFNIVLNFTGSPTFTPQPNFRSTKHICVLMLFPSNYTATTTTVMLNAIRCTPTGGLPPVAPAAAVSSPAGSEITGSTVTFQVDFSANMQPLSVNGFSASDIILGGTAPGTKVAAVSGGPSSYTVVVSGMTGSGTVTAQVQAGIVKDAWDQTNSASDACTVNFTKAVPPAITSANTATFIEGTAGAFTPTATGNPAPAITHISGVLPDGLTFTVGSITGTPNMGTARDYPISLRATNGFAPDATQTLTVKVIGKPALGTPTATAIAPTTATLGATITRNGNATITGAGVAYGTAANPTIDGAKVTSTATSGVFTVAAAGLQANTVYNYRGYATNSQGTAYTENATFTTVADPPTLLPSPTEDTTPTSFLVAWTPPAGGAEITEYRLDVSTTNTFASYVTGYSNLAVAGVSQTVTGLTPGMTYYYRVRAVNAGGTSASSTTGATMTVLAPPASLTASDGTSTGTISLSWPAVVGATHYQVYRAISLDGARTAITGWQGETVCTDTPPSVGTDYFYWVKATSDGGTTVSEDSVAESGWAVIPAPTNLIAGDSASITTIPLAWDAVATLPAEGRYRVYRAEAGADPLAWTALTGWIAGTSATDTTAAHEVTYVYAVTAAADGLGTRESAKSLTDAGTLAPARQPDLMIKGPDDADFLGQDVYAVEAAQTTTATTLAGATYYLRLGNDSTVTDTLALFGPAGADGWTIRYFLDGPSGVEITPEVTGIAGWTSAIASGEAMTVRMEVTADTAVAGNAVCVATVTLHSLADPTMTDAVVARTIKTPLQQVQLTGSPASPIYINTPVTFTAATVGGGTPEFMYVVGTVVDGETTWGPQPSSYTADATFTWVPDAIGTYRIMVIAREQGTAPTVTATLTYQVALPFTGVGLTALPADRSAVGTPVTATATPAGGIGVEYQFHVGTEVDGEITWEPLPAGFTADPVFHWVPDTVGAYHIEVIAREQGASTSLACSVAHQVTDPLTVVTLTADVLAPRPSGSAITLTATATGGANLVYQFKAGETVLRDFAPAASYTWTPTVPGDYALTVVTKDIHADPVSERGSAVLNYPITAPLASVTLTAHPVSPRPAGSAITLTATATGGANLVYQFNAGETVLRDFAPEASYTWTPTQAGDYTLTVIAKDVNAEPTIERTSAAESYTVTEVLSAVALAIDVVGPRPSGSTIALTATPTGGAAPLYRFRVGQRNDGIWQWTILRDFASEATCTWTPTAAGQYTLVVQARDRASASVQEVVQTLVYTITAPLSSVTLTVGASSPRLVGSAITLTARATGGANLVYQFKAGETVLRDFAPQASYTWTPTVPGDYALTVVAKDVNTEPATERVSIAKNFTIADVLSAVTLSADIASPHPLNTPLTLTATPTGGVAVTYLFRAGYRVDGVWVWTTLQDYSTNNTIAWQPEKARQYTLIVLAREQGNRSSHQATASLACTVAAPITGLNLRVNPAATVITGMPVTLTAEVTGGSNVQYWFRVGKKVNGVWQWETVQAYGPSPTAVWTPTEAGTYTIYAFVRESGARVSYQLVKSVTYTVKRRLL